VYPPGVIADPLLECAVAVTEQHACATPHIHFQNIQLAIAVHIRDCHATGVVSARVVHGWLESSVAIA